MYGAYDDAGEIMGGMGPLEFNDIQDATLDDDGLIECPVVALVDVVLYPRLVMPLFMSSKKALASLDAALERENSLICVAQRHSESAIPRPEDLYTVASEVAVGRTLRMPDGTTSALVQGRRRVEIVEFTQVNPYLRARARPIYEPSSISAETQALMNAVLELFERCVQLNRSLPESAYIFAINIQEPGWLADLVAATLSVSLEDRQEVLEMIDPVQRLHHVSILLAKELDRLELEDEIHDRVQQAVDGSQREMFLREQMRVIQGELGEGDVFQEEFSELHRRIEEAKLPEEAHARAMKELGRLAAMPPMAPEVGIIRTYLDLLTDLPWTKETEDNLDITHAAEVLESNHFGLPKAKERILEHIAVRRLAPDRMKSPILCFVGPPGTGKTSLGQSIAQALNREFMRVSLGGVRDEAEIRGHRRTYIGALPGRIIQTLRRAGTINPLFMLDEIDKLGHDFRGDPAAALLEVLDPEQNFTFTDHYLDLPYDLSKVFFITTANYLDPVPPALEDRMEVIEFPGYTEEDKLEIARRFLIPRQMEAHGLDEHAPDLRLTEGALKVMIRSYTYEAGVRNLEREIANVCRKIARRVAEGKRFAKSISATMLDRYLGPPRYTEPLAGEVDEVGVATGVAWTQAGGDVMPVEVTLMSGKGNLMLTGHLGDIMQESAQAALSYTRSQARKLKITVSAFDKKDIHLHVPEGAIPKEGPSAGVALAIALISAFTGRKVHRDVAMTGEITLRGRVLPVGGVKEKVLAARRIGVSKVVLPKKNEKDLVDVPKRALKDLDVVLVESMEEVIKVALHPVPRKPPAKKSATATKTSKPDSASAATTPPT